MQKMTWYEQLKHPQWQKRRLQMLEAAGWQCANCAAEEITLNVHHKRYVKGRKAWEYGDGELEVLCEQCHKTEHEVRADIDEILLDSPAIEEAAALLAAYYVGGASPEVIKRCEQRYPLAFIAGYVANIVSTLDVYKMRKVADFAAGLTKNTYTQELLRKFPEIP